MDRGAWRATVHRAAKSQTQLKQLSMHACSHPYMTTGKTIAFTMRTFVSRVMSLLFNMLSRLVIAFLPRSKRLNFMAAVTVCSDFGGLTHVRLHLAASCFGLGPASLPHLQHLARCLVCIRCSLKASLLG